MKPETALSRLAEDPDAPLTARCEALKQIKRPKLIMLRRLLANIPRPKPVPAKLKAIAALAYARETEFRKMQAAKNATKTTRNSESNALGI